MTKANFGRGHPSKIGPFSLIGSNGASLPLGRFDAFPAGALAAPPASARSATLAAGGSWGVAGATVSRLTGGSWPPRSGFGRTESIWSDGGTALSETGGSVPARPNSDTEASGSVGFGSPTSIPRLRWSCSSGTTAAGVDWADGPLGEVPDSLDGLHPPSSAASRISVEKEHMQSRPITASPHTGRPMPTRREQPTNNERGENGMFGLHG